jgi:hypothetical protein
VPEFFEKNYPSTPTILSPEQAADRIIDAKLHNKPLGKMPFVADEHFEM